MKKRHIAILLVFMLLCALSCMACHKPCEHSYTSGVCDKCGETAPTYTPPCEHNFIGGVCDKCGETDPTYTPPCTHPGYENGNCITCGTPCAHPSYEEGVCTTCAIPCTHPSYEEGDCTVCGTVCNHSEMNEGVCGACGYRETPVIPEDGGASMYSEIITAYKDLILYKRLNEELPPKPSNPKYYTDAIYEVAKAYDPTIEVGYAMKDIDGDGYLELVLMGRESRLYALFTIYENTPKTVAVFQNGMGYLTPDGTIFHNSSITVEKKTTSERFITRLLNGSLVGISYGWVDTDGSLDTDEDTYYFVTDENGTQTIVEKSGKYKEYTDTYDYFWSYPTRLTKLSELVYIPALPMTFTEVPTADFSSYDAIIRTFALMHQTVSGGKFERSKWISGQYDFSMSFLTQADFHLYNRLLSATVLVQNSSTASFGTVRTDLDGNGTEELILMESKYYVLAIFTTVDGKPLLLDSFTDLRSCAIDKDGKLHIKERIIPGHKKNYEYTLCRVEGDKLVAEVYVGIQYAGTSTVVRTYKIEDGEQTDLTQSQYDALYAQYNGNIGTTAYHTYTKNNCGLTIVALPTVE